MFCADARNCSIMCSTRPIFISSIIFLLSKQTFDFSFILTTLVLSIFFCFCFSIGKSKERKTGSSLESWISFLLMLILFSSIVLAETLHLDKTAVDFRPSTSWPYAVELCVYRVERFRAGWNIKLASIAKKIFLANTRCLHSTPLRLHNKTVDTFYEKYI